MSDEPSNPFHPASSIKVLEWLAQYRKLTEKKPEQLTPTETKKLQDLEMKISALIGDKSLMGDPKKPRTLRVNHDLAVEIKSAGELNRVYMKNISGGGVYVETPQPFSIGSKVSLQLLLPNETVPLTISTEVAWTNPKGMKGLPAGMGLKFVDLTDEQYRKIRKVMNQAVDRALHKNNPSS